MARWNAFAKTSEYSFDAARLKRHWKRRASISSASSDDILRELLGERNGFLKRLADVGDLRVLDRAALAAVANAAYPETPDSLKGKEQVYQVTVLFELTPAR